MAFDVIGFAFFAALFWYGPTFAEKGFSRVSMIYAIPKGWFFSAVPAAGFIACVQLALVGVHDWLSARPPKSTGAAIIGGGGAK
ncbi:MAG: TRAP-type C4-dicarboxylate transport system permease small subunit [Paracoccaceae bacterium]